MEESPLAWVIGLPDEKIKELVRRYLRQEIYTSFDVREADQEKLASIFLPLRFLDQNMMAVLRGEPPGMLYAETRGQLPRAIDGYPMFDNVAFLNQADARTFLRLAMKMHQAALEALDG